MAQFYGCSPAEVLTRLPRGKMLWVAPDRAAKKRCYQASVADILQLSDHQLESLVGQPFIAVVGLEEHLNLRLPTVANLITDGFLRKASPWEASMLVFGAALCGVIAGSLRIWVGAIALTCGLLALRAAACHAILLPVSSLVCAMLTAWLLTLILRSSDRTDEINAALERLAQPPPC